jgi:hypothetical protein
MRSFADLQMSVVRDVPIGVVQTIVRVLTSSDHILPNGTSFAVTDELKDPARRRVYMTLQALSKLKNTTSFDPTYWEED